MTQTVAVFDWERAIVPELDIGLGTEKVVDSQSGADLDSVWVADTDQSFAEGIVWVQGIGPYSDLLAAPCSV